MRRARRVDNSGFVVGQNLADDGIDGEQLPKFERFDHEPAVMGGRWASVAPLAEWQPRDQTIGRAVKRTCHVALLVATQRSRWGVSSQMMADNLTL